MTKGAGMTALLAISIGGVFGHRARGGSAALFAWLRRLNLISKKRTIDMTNLMEAEVLFYDPDLDFDPAIQALTKLGLEIEVLDRTDARIKISIVTELSEDDFHAWVDTLPRSSSTMEKSCPGAWLIGRTDTRRTQHGQHFLRETPKQKRDRGSTLQSDPCGSRRSEWKISPSSQRHNAAGLRCRRPRAR
jgi:hypothetical protein